MGFVAGQIIKRMADKGWPAVRHGDFIRSAAEQKRLRAAGRSKAGPWESPHQYGLAVDIIHATRGWDVSDRFWEDLQLSLRSLLVNMVSSLNMAITGNSKTVLMSN